MTTTQSSSSSSNSNSPPRKRRRLEDDLRYGYYEYENLKESHAISITPTLGAEDSAHIGRNVYQVELLDPPNHQNEISLCHIPTLFRWSDAEDKDVSFEAYGGSAAALLAMHHFNTGDASVVDELEGITDRCSVRLSTELIDTKSSGITGTRRLLRLLTRPPPQATFRRAGTTKITTFDIFEQTTTTSGSLLQPCAVIGSSWSDVTRKLATLTGVYDLPQVSPSASSVTLDDPIEYPLFARTHPSDLSMAKMSVDYLTQMLGVKHFAVVYIDNAFGDSYHSAILDQVALYNTTNPTIDPNDHVMNNHPRPHEEEGLSVGSVSFRPDSSKEEIKQALSRLDKGYHYFLGVFFAPQYNVVMESAMELGLAGSDRFWMFNGALASSFVNGQTDIPLNNTKLINATYGSAILHDEGGLPGLTFYDRFLLEWTRIAEQDSSFLKFINEHVPDERFERSAEYFLENPSHIAAFSYDAVIGLGLAACQAQETNQYFTGEEHHSKFVNNTFLGATGNVTIGGQGSLSRLGETTYHVISNILPIENNDDNDDVVSFRSTPSVLFDTEFEQFVPYGDPFIYSSGTITPPRQLPELSVDTNNAGMKTRTVCLTLSGVGMFLSVGFMLFTYLWRKQRVIVASQPLFLGFACFGTMLMASSIIPATVDDSYASVDGCSFACVAKYWLLSSGFSLSFAILFSKLWRVNRLMHSAARFRRIQVNARDVMVPCIVLLGINTITLTIWSVLYPPKWRRVVLNTDTYGRVIESIGSCHYGEHGFKFISTILVINGCALVMALVQAYHARVFTTELSESKYIGMATVCIFQACFIGIPILILVDENEAAVMFIWSGIVTIICWSLLLLLFCPKIRSIIRNENPFADPTRHSKRFSLKAIRASMKGGGTANNLTSYNKSSGSADREPAKKLEVDNFTRRMSGLPQPQLAPTPEAPNGSRTSERRSNGRVFIQDLDTSALGDLSSSHPDDDTGHAADLEVNEGDEGAQVSDLNLRLNDSSTHSMAYE